MNSGKEVKMWVLTYIKIGAAVVILGVWGKFAWNYYHLAGKIVALKEKVAGLQLRADVIEKA